MHLFPVFIIACPNESSFNVIIMANVVIIIVVTIISFLFFLMSVIININNSKIMIVSDSCMVVHNVLISFNIR